MNQLFPLPRSHPRRACGEQSHRVPPTLPLLVACAISCAACAQPSGDQAPATLGDVKQIIVEIDATERRITAACGNQQEAQAHAEQQATKIQEQADTIDRCNATLARTAPHLPAVP